MKGIVYFILSVMLLALVFLYFSLQLDVAMARLMPLALSIALLISCGVGLFVELRKKAPDEKAAREAGRARPEGATTAPTRTDSVAVTLGWLLGFILLMVLIGFVLAIPVFVVAYMKAHGIGWIKSIMFGLLMGLVTYFVFDIAFGIRLFKGFLPIPLYQFLP